MYSFNWQKKTYSQYALSSCLHRFHILESQNKKADDEKNFKSNLLTSVCTYTCKIMYIVCIYMYAGSCSDTMTVHNIFLNVQYS